jgi:hypothetical protein
MKIAEQVMTGGGGNALPPSFLLTPAFSPRPLRWPVAYRELAFVIGLRLVRHRGTDLAVRGRSVQLATYFCSSSAC